MKMRIVVLLTIIILGGTCNMFFISRALSTNLYVIVDKFYEEDTIVLEGRIINSSMKYKGYSYKLKEGDLYIEVYGSGITPFDKPGIGTSGRFRVVIDRRQFEEDIENIYFQGNKKKDRKKIDYL